jgi:hypothetical protein
VKRLALGPGQLGKLLGLADRPGRLVGDFLAERGEADHPASALDECDPKQGFELAKAGRQRRLGDEAGLGGPSEMAVLRSATRYWSCLRVGRWTVILIEYSNQSRVYNELGEPAR